MGFLSVEISSITSSHQVIRHLLKVFREVLDHFLQGSAAKDFAQGTICQVLRDARNPVLRNSEKAPLFVFSEVG